MGYYAIINKERGITMGVLKRREAREIVVSLLFETEFKDGESVAEIYDLSSDNREIPEDEYIKRAYFGVCENKEQIDALIGKTPLVELTNTEKKYDLGAKVIAKVEFFGKEELILLDRRGKKRLKKKKKLGVYTANPIPNTLYALFCEIDGVEGYILLELDEFAKNKINERIARAAHTYAIDER